MQKTYSVAELADALDVARTTVNDWLKSYAAYCDTAHAGKRKVYLESTLAVLMEVKKLRGENTPLPAIQHALAAKFGIRPEVADEPPQDSAVPEAPAEAPIVTDRVSTLPASVEKSAQLAAFRREDAEFIVERFNQVERSGRRNTWLLIAGMILLVAALALAMQYTAVLFRKQFSGQQKLMEAQQRELAALSGENARLRQDLATSSGKLEAFRQQQLQAAEQQQKQLVQVSGALASVREETTRAQEAQTRSTQNSVTALQAARSEIRQLSGVVSEAISSSDSARKVEIEQLKKSLELQRKAFAAELQKLARDNEARAERERIKLRDEFAKSQREALEKLLIRVSE